MNNLSEFSFKCKDGVHKHIYNPNAKISSLLVFKGNKLVYREDYQCLYEEYHVRRVQYDFNQNYVYLPGKSGYKLKKAIKNFLFESISLVLIFVVSIIYFILFGTIITIEFLNGEYVSKKAKSSKSIAL